MIFSTALLVVTILLSFAFDASEPLLLPLAEQEFTDIITNTVYECVKDIDLKDTIKINYDKNGKITHMSTDTAAINNIVSVILIDLEEKIGEEDIKVAIPLGDIVGDALSLGQGPDVLAELNQYRSVKANIESNFESAGINQTLHTLTLFLDVEAVILLPGINAEKIALSLSIPLSETLIMGETPKTYISK